MLNASKNRKQFIWRLCCLLFGFFVFGLFVIAVVVAIIRKSCSNQMTDVTGSLDSSEIKQRNEINGKAFIKQCLTLTANGEVLTVSPSPLLNHNRNTSSGIPMLLHRTWKDEHIPEKWKHGYNSCLFTNPDFQFCLWTDDDLVDFIASEYPEFLRTFLEYPFSIQRVDAARYYLLYHYGGVYMDLDIACRVPFADIFSRSEAFGVMMAEAEPTGVVSDFLVTKSKHPFMHHVISGLSGHMNWFGLPYLDVMLSTGPWFLSGRYWTFLDRDNTVKILSTQKYRDQYFRHLAGSSWHCIDGAVIWWIFKMRYRILGCFIISVAVLIFRIYSRRVRLTSRLYSICLRRL